MFFQDKQMKDAFSAYPELIFLDATYKLLQLGLPTYIMLCEDSNGQSEVFAVCLLVTEDASSMTWMMDTFKKCNSDWEKVHVVMADKDIGERDVIKKCLPNVSVYFMPCAHLEEKSHATNWAFLLDKEIYALS